MKIKYEATFGMPNFQSGELILPFAINTWVASDETYADGDAQEFVTQMEKLLGAGYSGFQRA